MNVAACFCLVSLLEIQQQQEKQEQEQEKGRLMVMADPSDLGHGKKGHYQSSVTLHSFCCQSGQIQDLYFIQRPQDTSKVSPLVRLK